MIDKNKYNELLKKYLDGDIKHQEQDELFKMIANEKNNELLAESIDKDLETNEIDTVSISSDVSEDILVKILASEKNTHQLFIPSKRIYLIKQLSIAAIFLVIVFGAFTLYNSRLSKTFQSNFEASKPQNNLVKTNTNNFPLEMVMEDGSTVKLAPKSSLSYPLKFSNTKREVYLTGEAFFVITKNPEKPFFVYYNNIVTKVLGTSFTIKTNNRTNNVEVSVKTGKVQVFENKYIAKDRMVREDFKSVIVIPNQKAMYNPLQRIFETTIADSIHPLIYKLDGDGSFNKSKINATFIYAQATSLKSIFLQLEKVYGIELVVENENIYNCVFTGDVSKQEMLDKLHIICLTIGATYEVNGTKILITGKGCN